MGGPATSITWEEVYAAADEGRDSDLAAALTERWRAAAGATGAALYLDEDGAMRREVAVGQGTFPPDAPDSVPSGHGSLELPGGLLLYAGAEVGGGPGGEEAAAIAVHLALVTRLCSLKRRLKRQSFEASYRGVEQQALYDVGLAITSTLNLDDLSEAILSWALSLLDARRAALYLVEDGGYRLSRALGGAAKPHFAATADLDELPSDLLPGASHLLAARIEIDDSLRGLLVVADKESRRGVGPFGDSDRRTLRLFANQAAIALENANLHRQALEKERLEREMVLAADIQRQILPKGMPEVPGFELAGWNRPARQVGGDYYDVLPADDDRLILTVGDVSGKGMPAALMVSILHSALRLMLDRTDLGPGLVEQLNRHVLESSAPNKFITLLVAEVETTSRRLRYVNAGHNSGVVLGPDGNVRQLPSGGLPVGLLPGATYEAGALELGPGDLLCLYSDGITECAAPDDEEFQLSRLIELLRQHREAPLEDIVRAIDEATTAFAQGQPQADDQTVVLLRRL